MSSPSSSDDHASPPRDNGPDVVADGGRTELVPVKPAAAEVIAGPPSDPLLDSLLRYGTTMETRLVAADSEADPDKRVEAWREALRVGREFGAALMANGLSQEKFERLLQTVGSERAAWVELIILNAANADTAIRGRLAFAEANAAMLRGYHGLAATSFDAAAELMKPHVGQDWLGEAELIRVRARALAPLVKGYDLVRLLALNEATRSFQVSNARIKNEVIPLLDRMEKQGHDVQLMRWELRQFEIGAILTLMQEELRQERFEPARVQADLLVALAEELERGLAGVDAPKELRAVCQALSSLGRIYATFASAELARGKRLWDNAESGYANALSAMKEAGQIVAELEDLPIARDMQTALLNTAIIDVARRRLASDKAFCGEIDRWRAEAERNAGLMSALARAGINVQTSIINEGATATATASATAQASAEAVTHVFQVVRNELNCQLESLREMIARAAPDDKELLALKAEIDALVAEGKAPPKAGEDAQKGGGWFERVAKFAENAAKIVKAADEAAGPLGKIVKWVAPLAPAAAALFGFV